MLVPARPGGDDHLRVEGEQDRREVGGRVAVGDRAADGAARADLRVGQDREGVPEGRDLVGQARRPVDEGGRPVTLDVPLPG